MSSVPGFFTNILFYSITLQGNKLAQDSFFVTKIRFRIKLPVIMNGTVNGFPILNSDSGNAIHTAVSRYQHVSWIDNQSKSDIPITGNQKTMCWACVNILFIFVLKAIFNPIKNVFKPNKGKNRLINLMQHWRMHWSVSMVEFPVELSLIMLRKPKMSGKNVGWRQNLGLRNRFKKVQNLTLKFGAKKVRLVRDCIRYIKHHNLFNMSLQLFQYKSNSLGCSTNICFSILHHRQNSLYTQQYYSSDVYLI